MTKPKDKELFKDNTTEELEQFYDEYRNTEEGKFPRCLDPYILSFRKKYNYQIDNKEALHIVANILLDEICDRKYSDNNYEYLVPSVMNRGLDKESGNMVFGAAFYVGEDDIRSLRNHSCRKGRLSVRHSSRSVKTPYRMVSAEMMIMGNQCLQAIS